MKILEGKITIITGGGSGIGKETALLFAEAGSTTILAGRRIEPLESVVKQIQSYGGISEAYSVDLENVDESEKFGKNVLKKYGKVDILVNNAGHSSKIRSIRYVDSKEWESVFKVNVEGVYRLTQSLLESMIENKEGTIITVSSVAAIKPGLMGGAPYSSAKAEAERNGTTVEEEQKKLDDFTSNLDLMVGPVNQFKSSLIDDKLLNKTRIERDFKSMLYNILRIYII